MTIYNNDPVLLVEESLRFRTPTVVRTFDSMADAYDEVMRIVVSLTRSRKTFEVNSLSELTWYGHRIDKDKGIVRFVRARFCLVRLREAVKGKYAVNTESDLFD